MRNEKVGKTFFQLKLHFFYLLQCTHLLCKSLVLCCAMRKKSETKWESFLFFFSAKKGTTRCEFRWTFNFLAIDSVS